MWLSRAAEQDHAAAQFNLAQLYRQGSGVPLDLAIARKCYLRAAEQGSASAQYNVALIYLKGAGVEPDLAAALTWFERAADQGEPRALYNLGVMYAKGDGLEQNVRHAYLLFQRAAVTGFAPAEQARDTVSDALSEDERAATDALVPAFEAAQDGDVAAMVRIADAYASGGDTPEDAVAAARWYGRAAHLGEPAAQFSLGIYLEMGIGMPEDPVTAYAWYERAAQAGFEDAVSARECVGGSLSAGDRARAEAMAREPLTN